MINIDQSPALTSELIRLINEVASTQNGRLQDLRDLFPVFRQALLHSNEETRKLLTQEHVVQGMAGFVLQVLSRIGADAEILAKNIEQEAEIKKQLEEKLKEIPDVLDSLARLTEQTRMLVLNVSIEATRGNYSATCSVIAEEVADLADESEQEVQRLNPIIMELDSENHYLFQEISEILHAQESTKYPKLLNRHLSKLQTDVTLVRDGISNTVHALQLEGTLGEVYTRGMLEIMSELRKETSGSGLQELIDERISKLKSQESILEQTDKWTEFEAALGSRRKQIARIGQAGENYHDLMRGVLRASEESRSQLSQMQQFLNNSLLELDALSQTAEEFVSKTKIVLGRNTKVIRLIRQAEQVLEHISNATVQTRMLSVSSAMEAAKIGDKNQGFAKIATDIRSLAENAFQKTEQVRQKLHQIEEWFEEKILEIEQKHNMALDQQKSAIQGREGLNLLVEDLDQTLAGTIQFHEHALKMEEVMPKMNKALLDQEKSLGNCESAVTRLLPETSVTEEVLVV